MTLKPINDTTDTLVLSPPAKTIEKNNDKFILNPLTPQTSEVENENFISNVDLKILNNSVKDNKITFEITNDKVLKTGKFKLLNSERKIRIFVLWVTFLIILSMASLIILFNFRIIPIPNWGYYIIPGILIAYSLYRFLFSYIELRGLKKIINLYKENSSEMSNSLIIDFYIKLQKKQINQIWFTIFYLFYMGMFTLIFWGIQHANWFNGALNFKLWINNTFPTPFTPFWATITFSLSLLFIVFLAIVFTLIRRNHSVNFLAFFGNEMIKIEVIEKIRSDRNRLYFKIFIFSILIIFIFPIIIWLIIKRIRR